MKKKYVAAEIEIIELASDDIIVTSGDGNEEGFDPTNPYELPIIEADPR